MKVLDAIAYTAFPVALIALPFLIWNWLRFVIRRARAEPNMRRQIPIPIWSVAFFLVPVLIALAVGETSTHIGHDEVRRALQSFVGNYRVAINGKPVKNPDQVLSTLKSLHWIFPHHSSPTRTIGVEISDQSHRLVLWLCRDSGDPRQYWVFYPRYRITSHNEVGRIVTPIFDAY